MKTCQSLNFGLFQKLLVPFLEEPMLFLLAPMLREKLTQISLENLLKEAIVHFLSNYKHLYSLICNNGMLMKY